MKAAILYSTFLDHDGKERMIGGIETYLLNLAGVCLEMGIEPTVYQWARHPFEKTVNGLKVRGISVLHMPYKRRPSALLKSVADNLNANKDILIFGSDSQSVRSRYRHSVSIQHGISWDVPTRLLTSHSVCQRGFIGSLYKAWIRRQFLRYFERCPNRVCVDYNFLNWYRTYCVAEPTGRNWVIPNFTAIPSKDRISDRDYYNNRTRILFARRFCDYRGTRLMAEVTRHILARHSNVEFTFAGEGHDETCLRECFAEEASVNFIKYFPCDTIEVHLKHDIAVIPSLGSEGTSLAVAEAMAAGCAVVATAVGGITNMLLDGYNGLLVGPNVVELTAALELVVESRDLRMRLGANAYDVAAQSFSFEKWQSNWRGVLQAIADE